MEFIVNFISDVGRKAETCNIMAEERLKHTVNFIYDDDQKTD
jgi:hypothetical protein